MYYTVIKQDGKYGKRVFSTFLDSSQMYGVFSQCKTWLRLLHLVYDTEVMWRKRIKHAFSMFDQSERAMGAIYIIKHNQQYVVKVLFNSFHLSGHTLGCYNKT